MKIESRLAQIGSIEEPVTGAVSFPIYQSTAFRHPKLGQSTGFDYARTKSPTRKCLKKPLPSSNLEMQDLPASSGMAALQTIFAYFSQGDHLIVSLDLYGGTYRFLRKIMSRFGVTASYVDTNDLDALESAYQSNTKGVVIETPTNPLMMITDLEACMYMGRSKKALLTIVDNTLLTPYLQRPIELGADIVIHSATKYLGGHNDVLAGLIVTKGKELSEQMAILHNSIGAVLGPQDSWLLMRGMKTLALRMERHEQNATAIANISLEHPLLMKCITRRCRHHPDYEIQNKQSSETQGFSPSK